MSKALYSIEIEQSVDHSNLLDLELWRVIPDTKGEYMISSFGRVKSIKIRKNGLKERLISSNTGNVYKLATLTIDGKEIYKTIHRLVAKSFIPNPENKPYVNHKDGNKKNNHVSNLEWVTPSENNLHSVKIGTSGGRRKYSEEQIRKVHLIRKENKDASYKYISAETGVNKNVVGRVLCGHTWLEIYQEFNN